ncbi:PLP-dependent aspartate aminotransferase family protein [Salirhabdus salicampi]|uniref:PLP-dependent aspartate aminotransferase family protein n=1 Tax=Salirhabdus salicampi TaxID=476102 RepID=UPI0020C33F0E|nr:PLP-dependent aspartate aminotransferase family protein [Salirhabdus salicampi]MCP8615928.1 PLP-dependent aspartate aminotransferase family protein [Salirhabdus salicampi]
MTKKTTQEEATTQYAFETQVLHGGQAPDPTTGSRAVPIYQTSSYVFSNTEHAAGLFSLDEAGNIYSRIGNPTVDVLEKRIALLENGVGALATASGQSAITLSILSVAESGDEILAATNLYGGTYNLFAQTLPRYGVKVTFVDPTDPNNFREKITDKTKAIYAETIGNPSLHVLDIEAVADVAHEAGIPLIVDNTFPTPYLCRPIDHGADIVVHSGTKWLGGHGTSIAGLIIDGGRFNWGNGKFSSFTEPDPSYNGIRYWNDFGGLAFIMKARVQLLRDFGPSLSPFNAFLILQGIETLHVRMREHCRNAQQLAKHLQAHPDVDWVTYPGLENHPSHELAKQYLDDGYGAVVNFGIKGGRKVGEAIINNISIWSHLANVGDAKSLIIHPASTTHQQLTGDELIATGVTEDLIRLSVGIEHIDDLTTDLFNAISKATGNKRDGQKVVVNDEGVIRRVLKSPTINENGEERPVKIAVVGLSGKPARPSYRLARKMQRLGYKLIPVNPREEEILGEKVYPDLISIPEPVDIIQVFRNPEAAIEIAKEAGELDHKGIFWLQEGVISDEAVKIAAEQGYDVVHNRCTYKETQRLRGTIVTYV